MESRRTVTTMRRARWCEVVRLLGGKCRSIDQIDKPLFLHKTTLKFVLDFYRRRLQWQWIDTERSKGRNGDAQGTMVWCDDQPFPGSLRNSTARFMYRRV